MTALRLIPLPIHAALEMLVGLVLGIAPFALGMSTAAAFVGVIAGVLVVGLALQSIDADVHIAAHLAADQGLALGLASAGAVMAAAGDPLAAALFAGAAVTHLLLILATKYTAR
ncbi:MAG TPA: hypothetical protein VGW10_07605 [Solirubrobacteraceae bacterium]|nr:hypothetical protein [Solirubrobacteraceae bacterium]